MENNSNFSKKECTVEKKVLFSIEFYRIFQGVPAKENYTFAGMKTASEHLKRVEISKLTSEYMYFAIHKIGRQEKNHLLALTMTAGKALQQKAITLHIWIIIWGKSLFLAVMKAAI